MDCPVNPAVGSVIELDLTTGLPATAANVTYTKITGTGTITGSTYTETVATGDTVIQVERCYDSAAGDCTPMYTRQFVSGDGTVATITYTNTGSQTLVFSAGGASVTVAPGASGTLTQVPISGTQACAGIDCVGVGGQVCDIYTCSFSGVNTASCSVDVQCATSPDLESYMIGDQVTVTVTATNTGTAPINNFSICKRIEDPLLKCPDTVLTDPTQFILEVCQDQLPDGVFQVNVDPLVEVNGTVYDAGLSMQYTTPGTHTKVYDLTLLPNFPTSGSGTLIHSGVFWYNDIFSVSNTPIYGNESEFSCVINYDFG